MFLICHNFSCFPKILHIFILEQPINLAAVNYVVKAIKNDKSAGSDGIVGKLIKHGGNTRCEMLLTLFDLAWNNEYIPAYWGRVF